MPEERHGKRDRRWAEQEVHKLGARKVGRVAGAGRDQDHANERGCDRLGIGDRVAPGAFEDRVADQEGGEGDREPQQRRLGQIDPEIGDVGCDGVAHRASPLSVGVGTSARSRWAKPAKIRAVTVSEMTVDSTMTAPRRTPSLPSRLRCWTAPTPAGTNRRAKYFKSTSAGSFNSGGSGRRRRMRRNSRSMPMTGLGRGSPAPRTRASPAI